MHAIKGTYRNGTIILAEKADWAENTEVVVKPIGEPTFGLREEDWHETPEAVAEWLRWYDSLQPLVMSKEEEAEWQAALQAQKEYELATFDERARRIERLFE